MKEEIIEQLVMYPGSTINDLACYLQVAVPGVRRFLRQLIQEGRVDYASAMQDVFSQAKHTYVRRRVVIYWVMK